MSAAPGEPADHAAVAGAVARVDALRDRPFKIDSMSGGLTNRSYRVDADGCPPVVVRLSAGKSGLLAIDRVAECHNAHAAATAGVGPRVLLCDPHEGVTVIEWIESKTFTSTDLDDAETLHRVARMCHRLHTGPRFANDFDMFAVQQGYYDLVVERGFRLPPRYREFLSVVQDIRAALARRPLATVPCHNDLLAANILDDGTRLWFIDYEYAGNNDACFELGNIWSEASLPPDRLDELVTAYFGRHSPSLIARARLLALMSKYGWTLWASIQDAVSDVGFDFWSWGMEKYERAVEEFDGPELARLIADVHQPH